MVSIDEVPHEASPPGRLDVGGPDDRLDAQEALGLVLAALVELTPLQQEVLRLRFQEELSY